MTEEIFYVIKAILAGFLSLQCISVLLFLIIEWAIVDFYHLGTFQNPKSKFDKITNFFMGVFFGAGYFFYKKLQKQSWLIRKLTMLVILIVQVIVSILIFYIVTIPLELMLNL